VLADREPAHLVVVHGRAFLDAYHDAGGPARIERPDDFARPPPSRATCWS
jgi:hypothetical protein